MNPGFDYIGISTSFICHDGEGRFLLGKRSKNCRDEHGTWEFGGGKLEFGATLEENVLRELKEEYGCGGVIDQSLPAVTLFRKVGDTKTHWITFPFFVRVSREEARLNEPESMDEIGWFRLRELPRPLHSGVHTILTTHESYFKKYRIYD